MNTNPKAKRILCFGDSYTWGYMPLSDHERFPTNVRWTGILQSKLGPSFEVIEEGLNGRTLISDDPRPGKEGRNGKNYLLPCLDSHDPLDLVILFLGSNELKDMFNMTAEKIGKEIEEKYIQMIYNHLFQTKNSPKILLIAPPIMDLTKEYALEKYRDAKEKNLKLPQIYRDIAQRNSCHFFDSSKIIKVGSDGVHFDAENHAQLGKALAIAVLKLFHNN